MYCHRQWQWEDVSDTKQTHRNKHNCFHSQWASYQIRKLVGCACTGNAKEIFSRHRLQRKSLVSDPGMHHGTCATHVPWCMSGSLTRGGGENVPGIPGACATWIFTYLARGPILPYNPHWEEMHIPMVASFYNMFSYVCKLYNTRAYIAHS